MPNDPIDVHVGERVRLMRKSSEPKISQESLADTLGMTFQQVQKYERGANRISASVLYKIAKRFGVNVSYFYEGLPDTESDNSKVAEIDTAIREATSILTHNPGLMKIGKLSRRQQTTISNLIDSLANTEADEVAA